MSLNIKDSTKTNNLKQVAGTPSDDVYKYADALSLEEIKASSSALLGNKIPNAEAVKDLSKKWALKHTISSMSVGGVYTIPNLSNYQEIGFILYGSYGCSAMQIYPYDVLIGLNGDPYSNPFARPTFAINQSGSSNFVSVLFSMQNATQIRCEAIQGSNWGFVKLEIYAK